MNTCKTCGFLLPSEPKEIIFGERCNCFNTSDSDIPSIEQQVAEDIAVRSAKGLKKYGFTVADNPLPLKEWLQHAYEESLDLPIYLKRAIRELEMNEEGTKALGRMLANAQRDFNKSKKDMESAKRRLANAKSKWMNYASAQTSV